MNEACCIFISQDLSSPISIEGHLQYEAIIRQGRDTLLELLCREVVKVLKGDIVIEFWNYAIHNLSIGLAGCCIIIYNSNKLCMGMQFEHQ